MWFMGVKIGKLMPEGIERGELEVRHRDLQTLPPRDSLFHPHADEQPGREYCKALNRILTIPSDVGAKGLCVL